jgi:hypothetical protein
MPPELPAGFEKPANRPPDPVSGAVPTQPARIINKGMTQKIIFFIKTLLKKELTQMTPGAEFPAAPRRKIV